MMTMMTTNTWRGRSASSSSSRQPASSALRCSAERPCSKPWRPSWQWWPWKRGCTAWASPPRCAAGRGRSRQTFSPGPGDHQMKNPGNHQMKNPGNHQMKNDEIWSLAWPRARQASRMGPGSVGGRTGLWSPGGRIMKKLSRWSNYVENY